MATRPAQRQPEKLLPSLAQIVTGIDGEVLFQISLDSDRSVMDIECLASQVQPKNMLPLDLVLEHPLDLGAGSVLFVSNSSGSLAEPAESDLDFTRRLIEAGRISRMPVEDHYIVKDGGYLSLRRSTDLWG
ncbi:MAG: repair protein RadC [Actinomycetota bacterium]|jgi:DNA repair protein RadC|nr:repair protein RadC [Actinomycetota bacterium]